MSECYWIWRVRAFTPINEGRRLLLETIHATDASKDAEVADWKTRRKRGGIGDIEVVDIVRGTTETV